MIFKETYYQFKNRALDNINTLTDEQYIDQLEKTKKETLQELKDYDIIASTINIRELKIIKNIREIKEIDSTNHIDIKILEILNKQKELLIFLSNILENNKE